MENASKALIMAGGVLIAVLVISVLIYAFNVFSEYQTSKDDLLKIEDTSKFNERFTNYDRSNVKGYEMLSLINQVIDYNKRRSSVAGATNDEKYDPVTVVIRLDEGASSDNRKKLTKDNTIRLFTQSAYTQSDINNVLGSTIARMQQIEMNFGGATAATNLTKSYDEIFLPDSEDDILNWVSAAKKFNNYCENSSYKILLTDTTTIDYIKNKLRPHQEDLSKYYEYMQFKRSVFKSNPDKITYSNESGRITGMEFNFIKIE